MTSLSQVSYDPSWGLRPTPPVDPMTTYDMFARSARHHPQKPALIFLSLPHKYNLDALGVPLGGEVKIADAQGHPVPIGARGEIWFKGPQVAKGYWNKSEETAKTFVVLAEDHRGKVTEADIIAYGKANMAAYKYPRQMEFIDQLPKSPIQKVLRKQLRDMEAARRQG